MGRVRAVPRLRVLHSGITTEEKKHGKTSVRVVERCELGRIRCVDMAAFLRVARTSCRSWSPSFRGPGSTLGQRRYLPSCVTKGLRGYGALYLGFVVVCGGDVMVTELTFTEHAAVRGPSV